jgi:hypothetical protein
MHPRPPLPTHIRTPHQPDMAAVQVCKEVPGIRKGDNPFTSAPSVIRSFKKDCLRHRSEINIMQIRRRPTQSTRLHDIRISRGPERGSTGAVVAVQLGTPLRPHVLPCLALHGDLERVCLLWPHPSFASDRGHPPEPRAAVMTWSAMVT